MSDDQDGYDWVSVSSSTGYPGCPGPMAVKRLCVHVSYPLKLFSVYNCSIMGIL